VYMLYVYMVIFRDFHQVLLEKKLIQRCEDET
jgi:hypothetical protein